MAGFSLATQSVALALGGNARVGMYLVVAALVFTLPPGGARSAFWSDAASGGLAMLIVLIGAALAALNLDAPYEPVAVGLVKFSQGVAAAGGDLAGAAALAAATAFFIPLTLPAIAAGSEGGARRMGLYGLAFGLLILAAAAMALPVIAAAPLARCIPQMRWFRPQPFCRRWLWRAPAHSSRRGRPAST